MKKADIIVKIFFDLNQPSNTIIKTNARKESIEKILNAWLYCQIGKGKDKTKPNKKDKYYIEIQLDLTDDSFYTKSDTGNKSLTTGLVLAVMNQLNYLKIENL